LIICSIPSIEIPLYSKECENSNNEDYTNEKIHEFIQKFVFETSDTNKLSYKYYIRFDVETNCSVINVEMKESNGSVDFNNQIVLYFDK
jgi:hypothetical protein